MVLNAKGYKAHVEQPLGKLSDGSVENRYGVVAHITQVPSLANVRKSGALMESLAEKYQGEYDGWEAEVAK